MTPSSVSTHPVRLALASGAALLATTAMRSWDLNAPDCNCASNLPVALWIPTLLLGASAILVWKQSLGAQVLARATWWANLLLGTLVATRPEGVGRTEVEGAIDEIRSRVQPREGELFSVSQLDEVIVCRFLGGGAHRARALFISAWNVLRPAVLGAAPCPPRIWST